MKNILFVCKYNRFRSQVAEQFFKKYNKSKNIKVRSAGIFKGNYPLYPPQVESAKKFGININKKPETITMPLLTNSDLIVIVADDVPKEIFLYEGKYLQEVIVWKIPDNFDGNEKKLKDIIKNIELKVEKLIRDLNNQK